LQSTEKNISGDKDFILFIQFIETSLTWSTFEQSCLWQLINAEDTPIEMLVNVLPALQTTKHAETLNRLMIEMRAQR